MRRTSKGLGRCISRKARNSHPDNILRPIVWGWRGEMMKRKGSLVISSKALRWQKDMRNEEEGWPWSINA